MSEIDFSDEVETEVEIDEKINERLKIKLMQSSCLFTLIYQFFWHQSNIIQPFDLVCFSYLITRIQQDRVEVSDEDEDEMCLSQ